MKIKEQNVYTDLFFNKPTEVLNLLDEVVLYENNRFDQIDLYLDGGVMGYSVPLEPNREILIKIFDIDRYLEVYKTEFDYTEIIDGVISIDLGKLIIDLANFFCVAILVDRDEKYMIYCAEEDFATLFEVTCATQKVEYEAQQAKEAEKKALRDGLYTDIMVDIETLDNKPSSVILSIAARPFNIATGETAPEPFSHPIDIDSQIDNGRTTTIETTLWWGRQSERAQDIAFGGGKDLFKVLVILRQYFKQFTTKNVRVWSRSPAFDLVIIKDALGNDLPIWEYNQERDVRTYLWAIPIKTSRKYYVATHVAIEDVDNQIKQVCAVYKSIHEEESNPGTAEVLDTQS